MRTAIPSNFERNLETKRDIGEWFANSASAYSRVVEKIVFVNLVSLVRSEDAVCLLLSELVHDHGHFFIIDGGASIRTLFVRSLAQ